MKIRRSHVHAHKTICFLHLGRLLILVSLDLSPKVLKLEGGEKERKINKEKLMTISIGTVIQKILSFPAHGVLGRAILKSQLSHPAAVQPVL